VDQHDHKHHSHSHEPTCALCGQDFEAMAELAKMNDKGEVAVVVRPIAVGESIVHLDVKFMGDLANRIVLRAGEDGTMPQQLVPDLVQFGLDIGDEVHRRGLIELEDDE
jgi:hypothetical protein